MRCCRIWLPWREGGLRNTLQDTNKWVIFAPFCNRQLFMIRDNMDPLHETNACFLDPWQEKHCLIRGSVRGDCYLCIRYLYSDNFCLSSFFKAEEGPKQNFQPVYSVEKSDIFDILLWKIFFRWQGSLILALAMFQGLWL